MGENPGPGLIKALENPDDRIRINTACLMVSVNVNANEAMPHLVEALKHKDGALRMQAAFMMAQRRQEVGKLTPFFLDGLKHETAGVRAQAAQGLQMLGAAASEAAAPLAEALGDADPAVRQNAANALQGMRGKPEEVIPILKKHFKSDDATTRSHVVMVAPLYGKDASELVIAGLKDSSPNVRQQAFYALQRNGRNRLEKELLPTLVEMAKDKSNQQFRFQIVQLLGQGGADALEHVTPFLKDEDTQMRSSAVQAIQNMGKAGVKAMPELAKMLRGDKADQVRHQAIYALVNLGPEGADQVVDAIKDIKDVQTRNVALSAIVYNSQRRDKAIPIMVEMMKDENAQMRTMVLNYCQNMGNIKECVEIIKVGIKDKDPQVRQTAVYACQQQGQNAWPLLEEVAKDAKEANLRIALVNTCLNTSYRGKVMVPTLVEFLKDTNPQVRWQACQVLTNIGAGAKEAAPAVRELLKDSHPTVRQIAQTTLNVLAPEEK
jgi:HEAT repeat protein